MEIFSDRKDEKTDKKERQTMTFQRENLPDALSYFESEGLVLQGRGAWRTTRCDFHGGSDSLRVHLPTGAFVCMAACGARGGDVLAYHRAAHSLNFIDACKSLNAWTDDGKPRPVNTRPTRLAASSLLKLLAPEVTLCVMLLSDALAGKFKDSDLDQFIEVTARINFLSELVHG